MRLTKEKPFPTLRGMMAKYGMNQTTMGELIGTTYLTFGKKLNNINDFTFSEIVTVWSFFNEKEDISIDELFFDWK